MVSVFFTLFQGAEAYTCSGKAPLFQKEILLPGVSLLTQTISYGSTYPFLSSSSHEKRSRRPATRQREERRSSALGCSGQGTWLYGGSHCRRVGWPRERRAEQRPRVPKASLSQPCSQGREHRVPAEGGQTTRAKRQSLTPLPGQSAWAAGPADPEAEGRRRERFPGTQPPAAPRGGACSGRALGARADRTRRTAPPTQRSENVGGRKCVSVNSSLKGASRYSCY